MLNMCPLQDDDRCEEWERHEALHDDVTSQERTKERLYEEEIELKWEKGGSGLVFYTDAQFWQEEEGGTMYLLVSFANIFWLMKFPSCNKIVHPFSCCSFHPFDFYPDFDEQTADDWDVDMSVYYDKGKRFMIRLL